MVEEIIAAHSVLVELFFAFLLTGFLIPKMTEASPLKFKKASFIYTMVFQGIATMVAFAGMVAMITGEYHFTLSIILMIIIWAVLMFIEIKKYKVIKITHIEDPAAHKLLKRLFIQITSVQVFLVAAMVIFKIMEAKDAISL